MFNIEPIRVRLTIPEEISRLDDLTADSFRPLFVRLEKHDALSRLTIRFGDEPTKLHSYEFFAKGWSLYYGYYHSDGTLLFVGHEDYAPESVAFDDFLKAIQDLSIVELHMPIWTRFVELLAETNKHVDVVYRRNADVVSNVQGNCPSESIVAQPMTENG